MSGYILFSSEMRAVIKAQHPDFSFGDLSRLVGTEWRNLESSRKAEYEGGKEKKHTWFLVLVVFMATFQMLSCRRRTSS